MTFSPPAPGLIHLWEDEIDCLRRCVAEVPDGGVIVEIGTAEGGSARIMAEAAAGRNIQIHTYDPCPAPDAAEQLAGTGVHMHAIRSQEGADAWTGLAVDLLFIDGDHTLEGVVRDCNAWIPKVRPGAQVMLHDFDSVERGGLVHLGVEVVARSLVDGGRLEGVRHVGRLLHGRPATGVETEIPALACAEVLDGMASDTRTLLRTEARDWFLVGEEALGRVVKLGLGIAPDASLHSMEELAEASVAALIFVRPLAPILNDLKALGENGIGLRLLSNLEACYLFENALRKNWQEIYGLCHRRRDLLHWSEMLTNLDQGTGRTVFSGEKIADASRDDLTALSSIVSHEQVRLNILARMLATCFEAWSP